MTMDKAYELFGPVVDLSGMIFKIAHTPEERKQAFDVRWVGYQKYLSCREQCVDEYDDGAILYVAIETATGKMVGCLRMLRMDGGLEVERHLDISDWLSDGKRVVEINRFSIPRHPRAKEIKLGLFKLLYLDELSKGYDHLVIVARRPAISQYKAIGFEDYPGENVFLHPALGNLPHYVLTLRLVRGDLPPPSGHPLHEHHPLHRFFCKESHSNIFLDQERMANGKC